LSAPRLSASDQSLKSARLARSQGDLASQFATFFSHTFKAGAFAFQRRRLRLALALTRLSLAFKLNKRLHGSNSV
jgi:hypothetical protein